MKKAEVLKKLHFGSVDSESEASLDKIFIQTDDFDSFLDSRNILVLGAKGAGKSALFRLFTTFENKARAMSGDLLDKVIICYGTRFNDIPDMDNTNLNQDMKNGYVDFSLAWTMYFAIKASYSLYDQGQNNIGNRSIDFIHCARPETDRRLIGHFHKFWRKYIGQVPTLSSIDFNGLSISFTSKAVFSGHDLLSEINDYLEKKDKDIWILLDKIDELFSDTPVIRKKCIEGLFLAYLDLSSRYNRIKLRIFLRTDIWSTLSFVNKSHLTDKTIRISWNQSSLARLLIKRACRDETIRSIISNRLGIENLESNAIDGFYCIFPRKAYSGPREADLLSWITERITDGQGGIYPRELINLANHSRQNELGIITDDTDLTDSMISDKSVRDAFATVSDIKVNTYLSEFPQLKEHFTRFDGQNTAIYTRAEMYELMSSLNPSGDDMIRQLFETGVIRPINGSAGSSDRFEICRLFRQGLGIKTQGRP